VPDALIVIVANAKSFCAVIVIEAIFIVCGCSSKARAKSLRLASKKYQSSRQGRLKNSHRQHRYRQSKKQKVTHQGSPLVMAHDLLESAETKVKKIPEFSQNSPLLYCNRCHRLCDPFLRLDFLQRSHFLPLFRNRTH